MKRIRTIARLDVKNEFVIKGIHLEGLRKVGNPNELARKYYNDGVDEIIFMDAVASLYDRNNLFHIIERACREVFIPITIGGGLRSSADIDNALKSGADKIALNTQAVKTPQLVREASRIYGSQCIVGSIEAKKRGNSWEAYIYNGRESTGIDAIKWAQELQDLGIGELLVTSVDTEGTRKGFDIDLVRAFAKVVKVPLIVSGGCGKTSHIKDLLHAEQNVDALAMASVLHYKTCIVSEIKSTITQEIELAEISLKK